MKTKILTIVFILALAFEGRSQMMYGPDTKIRSAIAPGAIGHTSQVYLSWLEYHSLFGEIKTGHSMLGGEYRIPMGSLGDKGIQAIGLAGSFQHRDVDFWKETQFNGGFASIIKLNEPYKEGAIYAALGIQPELFLYSQPRHLTREEYVDDIFLEMHENQVLFNMHWGWSIYSSMWYFDFAHHNAMSQNFRGDQDPKFQDPAKYIANAGYAFWTSAILMKPSFMLEAKNVFNQYKDMYLWKASWECVFVDEQFWLKYSLIKATSLRNNEFAHRLMIGGGNIVNVNFAYTFGKSQIYRHSQGNFELFVVYDIARYERGGVSAVKCSKKAQKHGPKKRFLFF